MTATARYEEIIEFTDQSGTRRRIRFVPQTNDQWQRIEEAWSGQEWRHVGQASVTDVDHWTQLG